MFGPESPFTGETAILHEALGDANGAIELPDDMMTSIEGLREHIEREYKSSAESVIYLTMNIFIEPIYTCSLQERTKMDIT